MDIVKKVEQLMAPICENTGTQLIEVVYEKERDDWYLRIFVDTDAGLTMDDCVAVTQQISAKLDEGDFIAEEYMLEVSSPGAERPLRTQEALVGAVGMHVNVKVHEPQDGIHEFQGDLLSFESDLLVLECLFKTRKKKIEITYDNVKAARLAIKF